MIVSNLLLGLSTAHAAVRINEVMVDPAGADTDQHWIELYNDGPRPVDLSGWSIERAKSAWDLSVPLSGVIAPGGWFVVGEALAPVADLTVARLDFGNASGSADAIRLVDPGGVILDSLVYGSPNSDGWDDDLRVATPFTAPLSAAGEALARPVDGDDSDDCSLDFIPASPTPGATNVAPPPPVVTCDAGPVTVLINELFPNPSGVDDGWEWVELHNFGFQTLDLSGWRVEAGTTTFDTVGVLPVGARLAPGGLLVVGQSAAVAGVDVVAPGFSMGNATVDADAVRLVDCQGGVRDTVVYGGGNADGWLSDRKSGRHWRTRFLARRQ
ncbi:MAG TPA: lamin tail domain-containing protein, partial [Myxococcota bacterium]|nr:lamin tail domain-containing protein [Myxococcota bacterium]